MNLARDSAATRFNHGFGKLKRLPPTWHRSTMAGALVPDGYSFEQRAIRFPLVYRPRIGSGRFQIIADFHIGLGRRVDSAAGALAQGAAADLIGLACTFP